MAAQISRCASAAFALTILLVSLSGAYARQLRGETGHSMDQVFAQGGPRAREYTGHVTVSGAGIVLTLDNGDAASSGPQVTLTFAADVAPPADIKTGDLVQLLGIFDEGSAGVLHVTQPLEILDEVGKASIAVRQVVYHLGNTTAEALTVAALSGASYAIRSISFIISYCGRTSDISAAALRNYYNTMQSYMPAVSHGGLTFTSGNQLIIGPITVPCTGNTAGGSYYDSNACSSNAPYGWQEAAENAARAQGINLANYPHRILYTPYNTRCTWAGLGSQNCAPNTCGVWFNRPASTFSIDELAHELGHNFGFFHSGKGADNYGDHSCAMGSYQAMRGYNGPVCWSAGLAGTVGGGDLTSTAQMPAGRWLPFSLPALTNRGAALLRLTPAVTGTSDTYFVSFRAPVGYDSGLPSEARNAVQVHLYNGSPQAKQQSWLQANLLAGQYWAGNGVVVANAGKPTPKIMVTFDSIASGPNANIRVCRWQNSQAECLNSRAGR